MTYHIDPLREIDVITKAFHHIIGYRARGTGLEALLFLEIAREEGCTRRYLQEKLGVDQSTISRDTRVLAGGKAKRGKRQSWDGKGLIYSYRDGVRSEKPTTTGRAPRADRLRYALTDKGREHLDRVKECLSNYYSSLSIACPSEPRPRST
jgi:DNA-binding MarR family transcriptional regulator